MSAADRMRRWRQRNPERAREINRAWYARNKTKPNAGRRVPRDRAEYVRTRQRGLKQRAVEYLGGKCVDCKCMPHLAAMDFHHRDPQQKELLVTEALRRSWENAVVELDKCVLLCSNCHRIRHATGVLS